MVLHYTHAMRKKFKVEEVTREEISTLPQLSWYVNFFTANRIQYILTTNAASLFSVLLYKRGMRDDGDYIKEFLSELREHLEDLDMQLIFDRVIANRTGSIVISKTFDRSVLGSMNDMVHAVKILGERDDTTPWDLSKTINTTPYSAIGYMKPVEGFRRLPLA